MALKSIVHVTSREVAMEAADSGGQWRTVADSGGQSAPDTLKLRNNVSRLAPLAFKHKSFRDFGLSYK